MCLPGWVERPLADTSAVGVTRPAEQAAPTEPDPIHDFTSPWVAATAGRPDRLPMHQLKERIYS